MNENLKFRLRRFFTHPLVFMHVNAFVSTFLAVTLALWVMR